MRTTAWARAGVRDRAGGGHTWGLGGLPRQVLGTGPGGLGPARGPPKTGVHMRMIERCPGAALHVQLLGRVEVSADDGIPVRLSGRHAQALFALLVLSRRPRSRDALATDLWPDSDGTSSAALRQALWLVRNAFNGAGLDAGCDPRSRVRDDRVATGRPDRARHGPLRGVRAQPRLRNGDGRRAVSRRPRRRTRSRLLSRPSGSVCRTSSRTR